MQSRSYRTLVDHTGQSVTLDGEIGRGGEGAVYAIVGVSDVVAKVYTQGPSVDTSAKLAAMVALADPALTDVAAWPVATLHERLHGPVVGLLMPRVSGYVELHRLYGSKQRKAEFPNADWAFLVWTARNVASAFRAVHTHGHVIGDVNQGNVLVAADSRVRLIDCDSFQVHASGRWFPCEVGVGHFIPPELQSKSLHGVVRTQNHDAFGLAVLIFQLLFLGRHPFMGIYSGRDMSLEEAIKEYRFAFGTRAPSLGLSPPQFTPSLAVASHTIAHLFERAFGFDAARDGSRPTATEWVSSLESLRKELRTCGVAPGHKYHHSLAGCPWCMIERQGGPEYFLHAIRVNAGGQFDLEAIWRDILSVAPPVISLPSIPQPPRSQGVPIPRAYRVRAASTNVVGLLAICCGIGAVLGQSWGLAAVVFGLALVWNVLRRKRPLVQEQQRRTAALNVANVAYVHAAERLETALAQGKALFDTQRRTLDLARTTYSELDRHKSQDLARLYAQRRQLQLQRHLERYYISQAKIDGIGPGRMASLVSFGIETAADVTSQGLAGVRGIGPRIMANVLAWRRQCESTFHFDPSQGVDVAATQRIEHTFARRRQELEATLQMGARELRRITAQNEQIHHQGIAELTHLMAAVEAAKADVALI